MRVNVSLSSQLNFTQLFTIKDNANVLNSFVTCMVPGSGDNFTQHINFIRYSVMQTTILSLRNR